jgi:hypothetical protein
VPAPDLRKVAGNCWIVVNPSFKKSADIGQHFAKDRLNELFDGFIGIYGDKAFGDGGDDV